MASTHKGQGETEGHSRLAVEISKGIYMQHLSFVLGSFPMNGSLHCPVLNLKSLHRSLR